jgi:hypothetical protein
MRTAMKSVRNIVFVLLVLVVANTPKPSANVSTTSWCTSTWYFQNWAGACAGGADACSYYRQQCMMFCYSLMGGSYCNGDLMWCQQSNHGTEWDPNYCLDNGWCQCDAW